MEDAFKMYIAFQIIVNGIVGIAWIIWKLKLL